MRSETKLVKTASRGALAGGGERDRLLDDCRTPDTDWLVSYNRPGLALASPDSRPRPRRDGQAQSDVRKRSSSTAAAAGQAALAPMYWPSKRWPSSILATKTADVASRLVCSRLELAKRAGDASFARNYASLRLLSLLRWSTC